MLLPLKSYNKTCDFSAFKGLNFPDFLKFLLFLCEQWSNSASNGLYRTGQALDKYYKQEYVNIVVKLKVEHGTFPPKIVVCPL